MLRKRRKIHPQIILDWFNITYRSLFLGILIIIAVVSIAFLSYYFYLSQASPRAEAKREIDKAEALYYDAANAAIHAKDEEDELKDEDKELVEELSKMAKANLVQARERYGQKDFTDSKIAAIRSQNLSQRIIDIARVASTTFSEVRFYKIEGDVKIKRAGSFIWEGATSKTRLRFGDQVKTSSTASAQVIYFDGTITTIRPGSLLEIREMAHERLKWGTILASTRKNPHEFSTDKDDRVKSNEPSELKMDYNKESEETSVSVYQGGGVDIETRAERTRLKALENILIGRNGGISDKEDIPLPPKIISPENKKIFVYSTPANVVTDLVWEENPYCKKYHLMISNLPLFSNPILDKKDVESNSVRLPGLPPDNYHWKVSCCNEKGIEGEFSEKRSFRIVSSQFRDKNDTIPPKIEIEDFLQHGPLVIISGKTEPGATLWVNSEMESEIADVDEDGIFYAVHRLRKEGANEIYIIAQDPSGNETREKRMVFLEEY